MRQRLFEINEQDAFEEAKQRFIKTCGFDLQKNKHQKMMKMGEKVREDGIDEIEIRAMLSFCDKSILTDEGLKVAGETLAFPYLERIPRDAVCGVYFYGLTVGECYFSSEENIMDFLYADIWGTNYVDASMSILQKKIEEDMRETFAGAGEVYLSCEFGPGYFGMPVSDSQKIMKIIDGEQIGIRVKESGLLIPQKSCMGFFFVYNRPGITAEAECIRCGGNSKGCEFCRIRQEIEERLK